MCFNVERKVFKNIFLVKYLIHLDVLHTKQELKLLTLQSKNENEILVHIIHWEANAADLFGRSSWR